MAGLQRPARQSNDPDKYIRVVKGGKYQARPFDEGRRANLGTFFTRHAARAAIQKYWWGKLQGRLKFARPFARRDGAVWWGAVVVLPKWLTQTLHPFRRAIENGQHAEVMKQIRARRGWVRVPGEFATAEEAHRAAVGWLEQHVGRLVVWLLVEGLQPAQSQARSPRTNARTDPAAIAAALGFAPARAADTPTPSAPPSAPPDTSPDTSPRPVSTPAASP